MSLTSCQWQGLADNALRNLGGTSSALKGGAALVGGSAAGTAVNWATGLGASALKGVVSAGGSSAFLSKAAGWVSSGLMVYGAGAGVYETGRRLADGDVLGALLSAGQSMADMHAASRSCFTAEMLLDCDGGRKRADQIQVGDLLWSRPEGEPDAKAELKPVEEVFVRTSPVLTIRVAGQAIRTTAEHPFWVQSEGWLPAGFLRPGDLLRTRGGLLIAVEAVEDNGEVETVYNWRIGEFHTYYVSANEDGVSLWVHNADYADRMSSKKKDALAQQYAEKRGAMDWGELTPKQQRAVKEHAKREGYLGEGKVKNEGHLNNKEATSRFGIYEITVNGELNQGKIGKADLNRVTKESGLPTRLHQQLRKLRKIHGQENVDGEIVEDLGITTTEKATKRETSRLQEHFNKTGVIPEGNEPSFKPGPRIIPQLPPLP